MLFLHDSETFSFFLLFLVGGGHRASTAAGNERELMATIGVMMAAMGTVREPALTTVTGLTVAVMALTAAVMAPTHNTGGKSPTQPTYN